MVKNTDLRGRTAMPGKNSTPPFQSKLIPFRKEILEAWFARKTLKEIQTSLFEKHGITIALSSLSTFIKRSRRQSDPHDDQPAPESTTTSKPPTTAKGLEESLRKLNEILARDPKEVAREYALRESRRNKNS
jgi:hypothetical protein